MAHMIEMPDGEYITPFCFLDALDAVEEYAGRELREFIEEYMQDNVSEVGAAMLEAEEARKDREEANEYYHERLLAVRDGLENLTDKLDAKRIDREGVRKLVVGLWKLVNDDL